MDPIEHDDAPLSVELLRRTSAGGGLHVRVERSSTGWVLVRVAGQLDAATLPTLAVVLEHVIVVLDERRVEISLAGLAFMDSSGVKALLATLRNLRRGAGELRLVDASPQARRLLELVGMDRFFELATAAP